MLNSGTVDLAIGLVFVYLMLSFASSAINEWIQAAFSKRSTDLEGAIRHMLNTDAMPAPTPVVDDPAAADAANPQAPPGADAAAAPGAPAAPARAKPGEAAEALEAGDAVQGLDDPATTATPMSKPAAQPPIVLGALADQLYQHALMRGLSPRDGQKPSYIPSRTFALALFDTISPATPGGGTITVEKLRRRVSCMPHSRTRQSLLSLIDHADGDLARASGNVARWFDESMDRLSGHYKRHIQRWLFVLGFVLAAATNADTISLARRLQHDAPMRASVTAVAATVDAANKQLTLRQEELQKLDLLFWQLPATEDSEAHPRAPRRCDWSTGWFYWLVCKLLGFMLSALAVSLGAPFWFDLLNRLVSLRSTGKKPDGAGGDT